MLARINRVRTASDFTHTVRSGSRSGRRNLVLYAVTTPETTPSRFGFIVSKGVGNAVTRNLVKRRLRQMAASALSRYPSGLAVVVRALPPAADATWSQLASDFDRAFDSASRRKRGST